MASNKINIPTTPLVGADLRLSKEWLQWLLNPSLQSINLTSILGVGSGGTGSASTPGVGTILVGNGTAYSVATTLPAAAFPALTGDITTVAGSYNTTLATVTTGGTFGSGTTIPTVVVNPKGLVTSASSVPITGAASMTVVGAFGCNGATAATSFSSGGAVSATPSTSTTPFGYTTAAQADGIVTLLNKIRTALVNNGIMI